MERSAPGGTSLILRLLRSLRTCSDDDVGGLVAPCRLFLVSLDRTHGLPFHRRLRNFYTNGVTDHPDLKKKVLVSIAMEDQRGFILGLDGFSRIGQQDSRCLAILACYPYYAIGIHACWPNRIFPGWEYPGTGTEIERYVDPYRAE